MNKQYNKADVDSWLNRAKDDLGWAISSLKDGFYPQTCFVAQQVVEKSLKALVYALQEEFVIEDIKKLRTHNLKFLIESIESKNFSIPKQIQESCFVLDKYYMPTRYPDMPEVPGMRSIETANKAIKIAEEVLTFVETQLEK